MPTKSQIDGTYKLIVDAIFGFSFKGNIRSPFDTVIETIKSVSVPICSVDVPSGKNRIFSCDIKYFSELRIARCCVVL